MAGEKQNQSGIERAQAKLKDLTAEELLKKTLDDGHISASEGREIMDRLRAEKLQINAETRTKLAELADKEGWSGMVAKLKALDVPGKRPEAAASAPATGPKDAAAAGATTVEASSGTPPKKASDAPAEGRPAAAEPAPAAPAPAAPAKGPETAAAAPDKLKSIQTKIDQVNAVGERVDEVEKSGSGNLNTVVQAAVAGKVFEKGQYEAELAKTPESERTAGTEIAAVRKLLSKAKAYLEKELRAERERVAKEERAAAEAKAAKDAREKAAADAKASKEAQAKAAAEARDNEIAANLGKTIEASTAFDVSKELQEYVDGLAKDASVVGKADLEDVRKMLPEAGKNKVSNHVSNGKVTRENGKVTYSFTLDPDGMDDFDHKKQYGASMELKADKATAESAVRKAIVEAYKSQIAERPEIKALMPKSAPAAAPAGNAPGANGGAGKTMAA